MKKAIGESINVHFILVPFIFGLVLLISVKKYPISLAFLAIPIGIYLLLNPQVAFLLALFFLPAHNFAFDVGVQIEIYYLFILLSLAGFLAQSVLVKRPFIKLPYDNFLFIFCLIVVLSSAIGYLLLPAESFPTIGGAIRGPYMRSIVQNVKLWFIVGSYLIAINLIRDKKSVVGAVNALLLSALSVCFYGVYQFIGFYLNLPFVMGIKDVATGSFREPALFAGIMRINSYAGEPKFLAAFLLPVLTMMLAIFCFRSTDFFWGKRRWIKCLFILCLVIFLLTLARGAWIALLITMFVIVPAVLILHLRRHSILRSYSKVIFLFMTVVVILSMGTAQLCLDEGSIPFFERFERIDQILSEEFATNIEIGFAMKLIKQFPITGVGLGNFTYHYLPHYYYRTYSHEGLYRAETSPIWFLSTLVETGIFGLLCILIFLVTSIRYAIRALRATTDNFYRQAITVLLLGCSSYLVYSLYVGGPHFIFFLLFGILMASARLALENNAQYQLQRG